MKLEIEMAAPLDDSQVATIIEKISEGKRVTCIDGCCTGTLGQDLNCTVCGKNLIRQNEINKLMAILAIAEERGQEVGEMLDTLGFTEEGKTIFKNLAQELRVIKFTEEIIDKEKKKNKKLKDHPGFKRLSFFIPFMLFVISYVSLMLNEQSIDGEEAFIGFPIISGLIALFCYIIMRIIYWVVDGFRKGRLD